MKSSLKTLTRIQKFNIDEQRKLMVEQQNKEEQILNDIAALNRRFEEEKAFAREHAGIGDFGMPPFQASAAYGIDNICSNC